MGLGELLVCSSFHNVQPTRANVWGVKWSVVFDLGQVIVTASGCFQL